jgi:hypothetical protein
MQYRAVNDHHISIVNKAFMQTIALRRIPVQSGQNLTTISRPVVRISPGAPFKSFLINNFSSLPARVTEGKPVVVESGPFPNSTKKIETIDIHELNRLGRLAFVAYRLSGCRFVPLKEVRVDPVSFGRRRQGWV